MLDVKFCPIEILRIVEISQLCFGKEPASLIFEGGFRLEFG